MENKNKILNNSWIAMSKYCTRQRITLTKFEGCSCATKHPVAFLRWYRRLDGLFWTNRHFYLALWLQCDHWKFLSITMSLKLGQCNILPSTASRLHYPAHAVDRHCLMFWNISKLQINSPLANTLDWIAYKSELIYFKTNWYCPDSVQEIKDWRLCIEAKHHRKCLFNTLIEFNTLYLTF